MGKSFLLICVLLIMHVTIANAIQIKSLSENETAFVKISSQEQTRIFVKGDRIAVVRGLDGAYDLKKDDKVGDIYIKPTLFFQSKLFNLFITTEQGHTFNLLMSPLNIPAETIELKSLSPSLSIAAHWETNSPYAETLINLIHAMVNQAKPDGYAIINMGNSNLKKLSNYIRMELLTIYRGNHLRGEVWKLINESKNTNFIHPRDFSPVNTVAVSLREEMLNPRKETYLYRVINND